MKIENAIEILEGRFDKLWFRYRPDNQEAVKLGIEALKDRKKRKDREAFPNAWLLPGETES